MTGCNILLIGLFTCCICLIYLLDNTVKETEVNAQNANSFLEGLRETDIDETVQEKKYETPIQNTLT